METDLLGFFQDRMTRSYEEQVWAVALVGSMNGFVISQARTLLVALRPAAIIWGIRIIALLALVFIWSRHGIYLHYDGLAKQVVANESSMALANLTNLKSAASIIVGWSGVVLYTILVIAMTFASLRTLRTYKSSEGA